MYSSPVCRTIAGNHTVKVYRHHNECEVVLLVAKSLFQRAAVCFADLVKRDILFHNLDHPHKDFLMQIVVKISGLSPDGPLNFNRQTNVTFPGFLD